MALDDVAWGKGPFLELMNSRTDEIAPENLPVPSTLEGPAKYQRLKYLGVIAAPQKTAENTSGYGAAPEEENPLNIYVPLSVILAQQPYGLKEVGYQKPMVLDAANYMPKTLAGLPVDDPAKGYRDVMSQESLYAPVAAEQYAVLAEQTAYSPEYREPGYAEKKTYDATNALVPRENQENSSLELMINGTDTTLPLAVQQPTSLIDLFSDPSLQRFVKRRMRMVSNYGMPVVQQQKDAFVPDYEQARGKIDYAEKEQQEDRRLAEIDAKGELPEFKVMEVFGNPGKPRESEPKPEELPDRYLKAA